MNKILRILTVVLVFSGLFFQVRSSTAAPLFQSTTAEEKANSLLQNMSTEEKIGQLFLVTFQGTSTETESQIRKLIEENHIGGVVLRAGNDNFFGSSGTISGVQEMVKSLQTLNWEVSQASNPSPSNGETVMRNYVPLLIGISQEGDLAPFDQIINGLTELPSQMAIGATWKVSNSETMGTILGQELHALGINLIFGPSLDVLDAIKTDTGEDLGVRTFGGDPYWVAEMGKAFIKGVHLGSGNQIAVIATHFPGRGGSDRQPEDEVATVRKSLEQLKQIELAPFFAVTRQNDNREEVTDGLLLSHIRYQGFQGNIRATTKPVSFDSTALDQIMTLPDFSTWRASGGILVSDDLGSPAVQKFFDPLDLGFDARQIIKSALLAGNDLLYTGNIIASGDGDSYTTILRTHEYFVQKYTEDSAFAQRVDQAVLRVLTLKYKLYPLFQFYGINPAITDSLSIGTSQQKIFEMARQAVTLVSPDLVDLDTVLQEPPQRNERIVFISNIVPQKQCSTCDEQNIFLAEKLRSSVERLYGPAAGEQVESFRLSAYTFENLRELLDDANPPENLKAELQSAAWIVISFTEFQKSSAESILFQRFFSEQPELARNKKIIGFAFNAPYYLDATDISKFTAYYAVYSKIPVFIDVAARILFQEIIPTGVLPVSVTSVGYDLITATTPDPNQIIPLLVEVPALGETDSETPTPVATEEQLYKVGDTLPLQTGTIIDHNGNPVPDGTVVRFLIDTHSASGSVEQIEAQTINGIARTTYRISNLGMLELRVSADPAQVSQILGLDITDAGGLITSIQPTFSPTDETEVTKSPVPEIPSETEPSSAPAGKFPFFGDWVLSNILILAFSSGVYGWGRYRKIREWNPRLPFATGLSGYIVYLYIVAGMPGSERIIQSGEISVILLFVSAGCLMGVGIGMLWHLKEHAPKKGSR
ncbi:MAG: hypothetical protein NTZ74_12805 [Chloroflexi bacterium]|nr:hypothetical protein [Chloroflexota bacterium]